MLGLLNYLAREATTGLYNLSLKTYGIELSIAIKRIKKAEKYNQIMSDTIKENNIVINTLKGVYHLK